MPRRPPTNVRRDKSTGRLLVTVDVADDSPETKARALREMDLAMSHAKYLEAMTAVMGFAPKTNDKRDLMRLGEWTRQRLYANGENDSEAAENFLRIVTEQNRRGWPWNGYAVAVAMEPEAWIHMGAARWADQTFPVVTMGERYFAALITARSTEERQLQIRSPWKAFVIEVPNGLLSIFDYDEEVRVPILRILVQCVMLSDGVPWWRWVAFTPTGHKLWREGGSCALATPVKIDEPEHEQYGLEVPAFADNVALDERMFSLIGHLILNTCEALTNPEYIREVGGSHERYHTRSEQGRKGAEGMSEPEARTYVLGKPIKVDCRPQLQDYVLGKREAREVQVSFLVRGHFKPKLSERLGRMVFIEPYMKRKDQAPILVREHKLEGEEE